MRVKTSITVPSDLLECVDRAGTNRSAFFERAARAYLTKIEKEKRDARDIEILNRHADRLNAEAKDVLEYQDPR